MRQVDVVLPTSSYCCDRRRRRNIKGPLDDIVVLILLQNIIMRFMTSSFCRIVCAKAMLYRYRRSYDVTCCRI